MAISDVIDRVRAQKFLDLVESNSPQVGIFWFRPDDRLIFDSVVIGCGKRKGNRICYPLTHKDYWVKVQRLDDSLATTDWNDFLHGKVVHEIDSGEFMVLSDEIRMTGTRAQIIKNRFNLNDQLVKVRDDRVFGKGFSLPIRSEIKELK